MRKIELIDVRYYENLASTIKIEADKETIAKILEFIAQESIKINQINNAN